jgi:glycosyltransferase involved in cell wall biosynthesis
MRIGITCYPTYGGSGVVATELGIELAALGHEVHFISYSQPFRLNGRDQGIFYHEVPVSKLSALRVPALRPGAGFAHGGGGRVLRLDLLHVHYAIPHSVSALLARQMLAASGRGCRLSPRCTAPTLRWWGSTAAICRLPLRHPGERRRHQHLQLSEGKDARGFRHHAAHRGDSELCELRCVYAHQGRSKTREGAQRLAAPG